MKQNGKIHLPPHHHHNPTPLRFLMITTTLVLRFSTVYFFDHLHYVVSYSFLCVSNIHHLSNNSSHFVFLRVVESFQGQYKDGSNGTHDFTMVSASFLILRILILALFLNHSRLPHTHQICKVHFLHMPPVCMLSQDHTS